LTAGRAVLTYGAADRQLAGLAALLGRPDEAIARYEAAARLDSAAGNRAWAVRARLGLAHALGLSGDAERARDLRASAAAEARELGLS